MAVDFAGFSKMVDALGGVEVCSTTPMEDYELGTVLPNAGRQMVDGHTALQYVRARQVTTETNGDYGRIKRQQLFLSSLLRSLISKEMFFSLSKLNNVVNMFIDDSYVDNMDTKDLVDLGQSDAGRRRGPHHVRHRADRRDTPTSTATSTPRTDDMRALFDAIINDDPLPEEKNADNTPVPGTPETSTDSRRRRRCSAQAASWSTRWPPIRRASPCRCRTRPARTGSAPPLQSELQAARLQRHHSRRLPGPADSTTVFFSPGNEQAAATVASSFANPTIERVTGMGDVVQVVLGSDFYSVTAPPPSGSSGPGSRRSRHQQHADAAARGSGGHQRRRHHLRIADRQSPG